ncbi:MAG: TonB family protein [candidate division KSB1 bacterium]|nr:TonB family protein [candidate division KSB1 bacterium]MDZ7386259.1 TonB family protein [candidate division KSB1 bacterium]MDZ7391520.1 TonB family protein [candidate division KSB1 bacterium]MDZ7413427.1 TonB family protein [candidate division KSB1 bacterium]
MAKERIVEQLQIKVTQGDGAAQRVLGEGERLTVGRASANDVVVRSEGVPERHVLLGWLNGRFVAQIQGFVQGEVWVEDSRLKVHDLVKHGLLPRRGTSYLLPLSAGKQGCLYVGPARVEFACERVKVPVTAPPTEFSLTRNLLKSLTEEPLFKLVLSGLLLVVGFTVWQLSGMTITERKPVDLDKVPQRFARFVVRSQVQPVVESARGPAAPSTAEKPKAEEAERTSEAARRGGGGGGAEARTVTTKGLLGLISGTGEGGRSGTLVDILMDKGLVHELVAVAGESDLRVGRREGTQGKGAGLEELFEATKSGGIDDLLGDLDASVPSVQLKKEGTVTVERTATVTGSEEARGRRDPEALRAVVSANMGRITYIYNKYLKRNPNLQGKVSLDITITASGLVSKVEVVESTITDREFINELVNAVRRWRFDPIESGTVIVNYPFVFYRES